MLCLLHSTCLLDLSPPSLLILHFVFLLLTKLASIKIACRIELISLLTITILIYNLLYIKRGTSFRLKANMIFPCVADFMVQIGNEQQNLHWWQSILSLLKIHITKVYQVDEGKNKYS